MSAHPFLKWAGGKYRLAPQIGALLTPKRLPSSLGHRYFEPFLGGGAVFFAAADRFKQAVLSDVNAELINAYNVVRDFPDDLVQQLGLLKFDKDIFYELRAKKPEDFSPVRRAARTIYLNKSCFNGLFRLNKEGRFNTPFGKFKTPPKILDEENLRACSQVLRQGTTILCQDFSETVQDAGTGDVVYFDPPYVPLNTTSNFTSYTSSGFDLADQQRLAVCFRELIKRGVRVVLSNSDTPLVRDLYEGFAVHEIRARRNINSKGDRRGEVNELLIVGG